jgi:hypothetical protein
MACHHTSASPCGARKQSEKSEVVYHCHLISILAATNLRWPQMSSCPRMAGDASIGINTMVSSSIAAAKQAGFRADGQWCGSEYPLLAQ